MIVSPTFDSSLFPNVAAKRTLLLLIFKTAKSKYSSFPMTLAISFSLFEKVTFTSFSFVITCSFVNIYASLLSTLYINPAPVELDDVSSTFSIRTTELYTLSMASFKELFSYTFVLFLL